MKAIIIGGGLTGCTAAYELSKRGWEVLLFEKENFLGGGCRTFFYGGHPYTKGPRPFISSDDKYYHYLNNIIPMRKYKLFLKTYVECDNAFYTYPIHMDDVMMMPDRDKILEEIKNSPDPATATNFEEFYKFSVGKTLYGKFIDTYTKKMWKIESNTMFDDYQWSLKGVAIKTGEKHVAPSMIHAYPDTTDGYNSYFDFCVKDARVELGKNIERFDLSQRAVYIDGEKIKADIIISTTSPDDLMDKCFGELPYIGRDFMNLVLPVENVFPDECTFVHYANEEPFTRVVEYKKLTHHKSGSTFLGIEIPSFSNKLYPSRLMKDRSLAQKSLEALPPKVYSTGRMGSYQYSCIAECIMQVLSLIEKEGL